MLSAFRTVANSSLWTRKEVASLKKKKMSSDVNPKYSKNGKCNGKQVVKSHLWRGGWVNKGNCSLLQ